MLNERSDDLAFIAERVDKNAITKLEDFINAPFERIDYTDAVSLLQKSGRKFDFPVEWGLDLQTEHERWLTEEHVGRPVVVTNYPEHIKAFYMRLNDDGKTVAAMDVLAPGIGEIIGGSQREERLDVLDARMAQFGLDREHYSWYRDSAAMARCRTPASAWASSAWWCTSAGCPTSAMRSPTRAPRAARTSKPHTTTEVLPP